MIEMTPEVEKIIFFQRHTPQLIELLPRKYVDFLLETLKQQSVEWHERVQSWPYDHQQEYACHWLCYQRSVQEALRLGYKEHPTIRPLIEHHPVCIIEAIDLITPQLDTLPEQEVRSALNQRIRAIITLGERYGLFAEKSYERPNMLWQVLDTRREKDAVIEMIGDDRGLEHHLIIVKWYPERFYDPRTGWHHSPHNVEPFIDIPIGWNG
jgi:hypothetical protein